MQEKCSRAPSPKGKVAVQRSYRAGMGMALLLPELEGRAVDKGNGHLIHAADHRQDTLDKARQQCLGNNPCLISLHLRQ